MNLILKLAIGALAASVAAAPALAQTVTRTFLSSASPSRVGQATTFTAEVDSLGGVSPAGLVSFVDGAAALGSAALRVAGAGQATLSAGYRHNCGLTNLGGVKCWGYNNYGQIGDGTQITRLTAVAVPGLASGVVAVAAGGVHSCALTALGAVKCWGRNNQGQLGNGTTINSYTPTPVSGLASGVIAIAVGDEHSCALTNTGNVMCWGQNGFGQTGNGGSSMTFSPASVGGPATTYTSITAGWHHSCATTSAGAARCWGRNTNGELGDGSTLVKKLPTPVLGLASGVASISADGQHSCAVLTTGAAKCWGYNFYGQVGDGSNANQVAPVAVAGLAGVAAIDAGANHSCAVLTNGSARCWGRNFYGQLGDGTQDERPTPVPVAALGGAVVAISAGDESSCAILSSRIARCWGQNDFGQIADGTTTDRVLPVTAIGYSGLLRARARLRTSALVAGWHLMRADYAGDATHSASTMSIPHWVQ